MNQMNLKIYGQKYNFKMIQEEEKKIACQAQLPSMNQNKQIQELRQKHLANDRILSHDGQNFQKIGNFQVQSVEKLKIKLSQHSIQYLSHFTSSFYKEILRKSGNSYFFKIVIGNFSAEVSFLKIKSSSQFFSRQPFASGNFATIYLQHFEDQMYAVKSQHIQSEKSLDFGKQIDTILKQYVAFKIASICQYGPKLKKLFGFDIVCFSNTIEYSMEVCEFPDRQEENKWDKLENDLFCGLKVMHSLQIVHCDIKKANIGYSDSLDKWVFLDFGFTRFLKEKPGCKTLTKFIGTYNHASSQMKNLFYLKEAGYVDLYENDVYGLNIAKFVQPSSNTSSIHYLPNSFLEKFFILLSHMQNKIFFRNILEAQKLFCKNSRLSNDFLGLMLSQIQRLKQRGENKTQLLILYDKLRLIQVKNNIQCIIREKQYKELKQDFMSRDQYNLKPIFLYAKETDLRKLLKDKWNQTIFMNELFQFFSEVIYQSKDSDGWKKLKEIIYHINSLFLKNDEQQKGWVYIFHQVISHFERIFLSSSNLQFLKSIQSYYDIMFDMTGFKRLEKILQTPTSKILPVHQLFKNIFSCIYSFKSTIQISQSLSLLKFSLQKQNNQSYLILLKITQKIVQVISLKKMTSQDSEEFKKLVEQFQKIQFQDKKTHKFFVEKIKQWKQRPHLSNYCTNPDGKFLRENEGPQKTKLKRIIEKLKSIKSTPSNQIEVYLKIYPICSKLPQIFNFQYNLTKRNYKKVNEIAQNIFDFNRQNLDEIVTELIYILKRWQRFYKIEQELLFLLSTFSKNIQKNISSDKIKNYWSLYSKIFITLRQIEFKLSEKEKNTILSSLQFIITFFNKQENLSDYDNIYLHLFISFRIFIEGEKVLACKYLQKVSQEHNFCQNLTLTVELIHCFVLYDSYIQKSRFKQTKIYNSLLSEKVLNWLFLRVPMFFEYVLQQKSSEDSQKQTLNLIESFTKYLIIVKGRVGILHQIFSDFLKKKKIDQLHQLLNLLFPKNMVQFRENFYLSVLLLMIYLNLEDRISQINKKRIILFKSAIGIEKFPYGRRISYQYLLSEKIRKIFRQSFKKKQILLRREVYGKGSFDYFKNNIVKKTFLMNGVRNLSKIFEKKILRVKKNLDAQPFLLTDEKIKNLR